MSPMSPVPPALHALAAYAAALERAATEHPAHARRLLLEAADVWFCLGRSGRATELYAVVLLANRRRRSRRRVEAPCLRARAKA